MLKESYRSITWSYFFVRHWLSLFIFIMLKNNFGNEPSTFTMSFLFLTGMRFHLDKFNIKEQYVYFSLAVLLDYFWRNIISIYPLPTMPWLYLSRTNFVSQTSIFGMYWLKSLTVLSSYILIISSIFINPRHFPQVCLAYR